jgi:dTDP-4-dehydrorhamnose 3,5-epimerase-like enzyme
MDARMISINQIKEEEGELLVAEAEEQIPFNMKRVFCISNVPCGSERGNHASKNSKFVYICLRGSVKVNLDDGREQRTFLLEQSDKGLFLPARTWMKVFDFSEDALLLVLASELYSADEYYENYSTYLKENNK